MWLLWFESIEGETNQGREEVESLGFVVISLTCTLGWSEALHPENHKLRMALICLRIVLILSGTLYESVLSPSPESVVDMVILSTLGYFVIFVNFTGCSLG